MSKPDSFCDHRPPVFLSSNNQGESVITVHLQAKAIWLWSEEKRIYLTAVHTCIKGKSNITADYMSRHFSDSTEWKLHERVFPVHHAERRKIYGLNSDHEKLNESAVTASGSGNHDTYLDICLFNV
jgi:hypothetical protein